MSKPGVNICWFRRDLRIHDNAALYHALKDGLPVLPLFIFDRAILDKLDDKADKRVEFIYRAVSQLNEQLMRLGSGLEVVYGFPRDVFGNLMQEYDVQTIFTNGDFEPYAIERDRIIDALSKSQGVRFDIFKDQVIFEKTEVMKNNGEPYTVFTPYSRKWKAQLNDFFLKSYPTERYNSNFLKRRPGSLPDLQTMGFTETGARFPPVREAREMLLRYKEQRDFPAVEGTSQLSVHLRFGTVSIRELARQAVAGSETFLNELIWREFYQMVLWNFPRVGQGKAFKPEYELIEWRNNETEFDKWCKGQTGYPIVDAGMRQLNETGYMHNRVRMITASFLSKHLLIDWRWGEAYFAKKLLDYDLAANNGGWQWAAGTGCDAAPYFRIFNPYLQTKKFDPQLKYVRRWVPEFEEFDYPAPMVAHEFARQRCLMAYSHALRSAP